MKILTKALIFQRTGIYLAREEENEFLNSPETQKNLLELVNFFKVDRKEAEFILISSWQAENGFINRYHEE